MKKFDINSEAYKQNKILFDYHNNILQNEALAKNLTIPQLFDKIENSRQYTYNAAILKSFRIVLALSMFGYQLNT